jgi:hypothetical protein
MSHSLRPMKGRRKRRNAESDFEGHNVMGKRRDGIDGDRILSGVLLSHVRNLNIVRFFVSERSSVGLAELTQAVR